MTHREETPANPRTPLTLVLLSAVSGGCAIAYELLFMRGLTTLFGDVFYVPAAILSAFILGVGVGGILASRLPDRLWLMELGTGIYAILFPILLAWISSQPWLVWITGSALATISIASLLALPPGILIGFSIPLFSEYLKAKAPGALAFRRVYLLYHLGTIAGVFLVEFLLFRNLGLRLSIWTCGTLNIGIGMVLFSRRSDLRAGERKPSLSLNRSVIVAVATAGFASAAFQMFGFKLFYHLFAPHRENIAIALVIALFGLFAGTAIVRRYRIRATALLLFAGFAILATFLLFSPLVTLFESSRPVSRGDMSILVKLLWAGLFIGPPMIAIGGLLPSIVESESNVSTESGRVLFVSCLANAAGYIFYVLLGHPALSTSHLLALISLALIVAGLLLSDSTIRRKLVWLVPAAILSLGLLQTWSPVRFYVPFWAHRIQSADTMTLFKSGPDSATLIEYNRPGKFPVRWVSYNGHASIQADVGRQPNDAEMLSGVIPGLHTPRFERAVVLGLGTGITAGTVSRIFEHTDIVEINEGFIAMAPELSDPNFEVASNPAAIIHHADARAFLIGKNRQYDLILNSIPAADYFAASKVYTVEFYARVKNALREDGIFCSWLGVPQMSAEGLDLILAAIQTSFDHCELRIVGAGYYFVTCSNRKLSARAADKIPMHPLLRSAMDEGFSPLNTSEVIEDTLLARDVFETYTSNARRRNSDDLPLLEFMVGAPFEDGESASPFWQMPYRYGIDPLLQSEGMAPERFVRKAYLFRHFNSRFFDTHFAENLQTDPKLAQAHIEWSRQWRRKR